MNPTYASDAMYSNERRVKGHRHNILYALNALGHSSPSQEITDEVNKKVELDVEQEFDPNRPQNIDKSKGQLDKEKKRELEFRGISRKTTDKLLERMVKRGLVTKKHHVYTLTPQGRDENIFGEYYGRLLHQKLMEMPFKGSMGEKLEEYIRRVGIYVTYIFMRNSNRSGIKPEYSVVREDYDEWVNDAISPFLLLEWFNNVFYSKSGSNNYDKLARVLNTRFTMYINNLETSEKMYYGKTFPFLQQHSMERLKLREQANLS
jgi:hypothetical protein